MNNKVQWIVSNELGALSDIHLFVDKIKERDDCILQTVSLENVLTPSYTPTFNKNIPTLFYGPVNFINRMSTQGYTPGIFGDNESYSYENLCNNVPHEYIFNNPNECFLGTPDEVLSYVSNMEDDMQLFFKPGDDSKFIIGQVCNVHAIKFMCNNILDNKIPDTNANSKLLVGVPYGIEKEYRLFVINGKISTGSEYKPNKSNEIPLQIIDFANKIISLWQPFPLMILDVCVSNNISYIMEIQNFHSAGFYLSDLDNIINDSNMVALEYFNNME
ncbi:MAG: hypothetical protein [Caudoviricetes sp.]|nr:MAG: hypothetical protein [Caudoviricetes sp.]